MAFVNSLIPNIKSIDPILQLKGEVGNNYIREKTSAAITIQRHFRGYYTRKYIDNLNQAALIIQKHWRGYLDRRYVEELTVRTFIIKSIDHYNKAATTIQSCFRGYYTRKYCVDIRKRMEWTKNAVKQNETCSKAMLDYRQMKCQEFEKVAKQKVKERLAKWIGYLHPMLRTKNTKGVFSTNECNQDDSDLEKLIRYMFSEIHTQNIRI